jgi:hypothetical protein
MWRTALALGLLVYAVHPSAPPVSPVIEIRGTRIEGGVAGAFTQTIDLRTGYNAMRIRTGVLTKQSGYDGTPWVAENGIVERIDVPFSVEDARIHAYIARRAWMQGATMPGVTVRYGGGKLAKTIVIAADDGTETVTLRDWRTVDGVSYPFVLDDVMADGERTVLQVQQLRTETPREGQFAPPAPVNHAFIAGAQPVKVPFTFAGRHDSHILVHAFVDGHDAPLIFDTGGANYFGVNAAKAWELSVSGGTNIGGAGARSITAGVARVKNMRLGRANLRDQTAVVAPLPWPQGVNSASGLTGFEFFAQFRTTVDYQNRMLEFSSLDTPESVPGKHLPFSTDGHHIFVSASVNGRAGLFDVDTGAGGAITLFAPFARRAGITVSSAAAHSSTGAVGGAVRMVSARVASFSISGKHLGNVRAKVSVMRSGVFASKSLAGNLGGGLLRCFKLTIDYRRRYIIFADQRDTGECLARIAATR